MRTWILALAIAATSLAARADDLNARLSALENGAPSQAKIIDAGTNRATAPAAALTIDEMNRLGGTTANVERNEREHATKMRELEAAQRAQEREETLRRIDERIYGPCPWGTVRSGRACVAP